MSIALHFVVSDGYLIEALLILVSSVFCILHWTKDILLENVFSLNYSLKSFLINFIHAFQGAYITPSLCQMKQQQSYFVIFVISITSAYLTCPLICCMLSSCSQFLWSCHRFSLWPEENSSYEPVFTCKNSWIWFSKVTGGKSNLFWGVAVAMKRNLTIQLKDQLL